MKIEIKLLNKEELSRSLGIEDKRAFEITKQLVKFMNNDLSYAPLQKMLDKCQSIEEVVLIATCFGLIKGNR